jgi:hypothetical protein
MSKQPQNWLLLIWMVLVFGLLGLLVISLFGSKKS